MTLLDCPQLSIAHIFYLNCNLIIFLVFLQLFNLMMGLKVLLEVNTDNFAKIIHLHGLISCANIIIISCAE